MKSLRILTHAAMPAIFACAFAPLVHYAYARTSTPILPTAEMQAFLKANPPPVRQAVAERQAPSPPKRPRLVVSISTKNLIVRECTEGSPQVVATDLSGSP